MMALDITDFKTASVRTAIEGWDNGREDDINVILTKNSHCFTREFGFEKE
jgi:hypothetical protein